MNTKLFMLPYKAGSAGCRDLAKTLGVRRIKLKGSNFVPSPDKVILNWGNSRGDSIRHGASIWINEPGAVDLAANKWHAFEHMADEGVPVVQYTTEFVVAARWAADGDDVVLRTSLRGSGGDGIHIYKGNTGLSPDAHLDGLCNMARDLAHEHNRDVKLVTRYFKAKDEYRVHVFDGKVIDVQQKRKRNGVENANYSVRNHSNGFVFCREGVELPEVAALAAVDAVEALGLDFGAVDLRYNTTSHAVGVLEVNTAPGLEGTTLEKYSAAVTELLASMEV